MQLKSICGVIIAAENPGKLTDFYSQVFDVKFQTEEHGELDTHYGLDIGEIHLGIHPPGNMGMKSVGNTSISIAYNVDSLAQVMSRLAGLGARQLLAPHDEGFGMVASYQDPEGNTFEVVELNYDFSAGK